MDGWTISWILWIAMFFCIEIPALFNRHNGDTLSEHLRSWFAISNKSTGYKFRRFTLIAFLAWFSAHILTNGFV
jgi:hypothetical protein